MPERLLFASHSAEPAGAELALLELVRGLARRGNTALVLVPGSGPLVHLLHDAGARTQAVPMPWWAGAGRPGPRTAVRAATETTRAARACRQVIREFRPDVCVTNTLVIPALAVAARTMRTPHVWMAHEYGTLDHDFTFYAGYTTTLRSVGRLSRAVIANSLDLASYLSRRSGTRVVNIPYAVSPWRPPGFDVLDRRPGLNALMVGQVRASKGHDSAVRALAACARDGVEVHLHVVGRPTPPSYNEDLRRLAASLGVEDRLSFYGFLEAPEGLYAQADVTLMCSRREAFGRVTVESLKMGTPVIGTASGGTPELVIDGVNGMLVPVDDAEALASALTRLLDTELRHRLGSEGKARAAALYSEDLYSARVLEILKAARNLEVLL